MLEALKKINLLNIKDNNNIVFNNELTVIRLDKDSIIIQQQVKNVYDYYDLQHTIIDYKDIDCVELREIEYYFKASYFDNKGNKILLNEERTTEKTTLELNIAYNDIKQGYTFTEIEVDSLESGLEVVKRINKHLRVKK